jgi:hypothetical protein
MIENKAKKGAAPIILSVGALIVIAIIIVILLLGLYGTLYFLKKWAWTLVGIFIVVVAMLYLLRARDVNYKVFTVVLILGIIILAIAGLGFYTQSMTKTIYLYSETLPNAKVEITPKNFLVDFYKVITSFFGIKQTIYPLEKAVYQPGETVRVKWMMIKVCVNSTTYMQYRICYKKSGGTPKCSEDLLSSLPCATYGDAIYTSYFTFTAPSDPGTYVVYGEAKYTTETKWNLDEEKTFEVGAPTTCPPGDHGLWTYLRKDESGVCEVRDVWTYVNPPICEKVTEYEYTVSCNDGYVIEGTNSRWERYTKSTKSISNCLKCVPISQPSSNTQYTNFEGETPPIGTTITPEQTLTPTSPTAPSTTTPPSITPPTITTTTSEGKYLPYLIIGGIAFVIIIAVIIVIRRRQRYQYSYYPQRR